MTVARRTRAKKIVLKSDDEEGEDEMGIDENCGEGAASDWPQVVANPLVRRGKGRPPSKRFRSATEMRSKARR